MYRKESERWFKHKDFMLLDMVCLQLAFILAYVFTEMSGSPYSTPLYRNMAIIVELTDIIVIFMFDTFRNVLKRGHLRELVITLEHTAIVAAVFVGYLFATKSGASYSRMAVSNMFIIYVCVTFAVRELRKRYLQKKMINGEAGSLLIVTTSDIAEDVVQNIREHNYARYKITGIVIIDKNMTGSTISGVPVVADELSAPMYVCQNWIDEVMVIPSAEAEYPREIINKLVETGVVLHINLDKNYDTLGNKQIVQKVGGYTVLTAGQNTVSVRDIILKRAMDIAGGIAGCLLTAVIFIFIAPVIFISSPGPIFFTQERVGKNGKKFKMYKFRSMYMDAEERKAELMKENKMGDARMFKMDFDPRVIGNRILPDGTKKTGIGDFIRRTSLDEFPQFFNVLKGDMSIVGTRPPLVGEVSEYEIHHRARLSVKPGITGLWQVSGRSDITDFEEVVKLDTQYIREWSIGLDVKILFMTVMVVLRKKGSV